MPNHNLITDHVCPFCGAGLAPNIVTVHHNQGTASVNCEICGPYQITGEAVDLISMWKLDADQQLAFAFTVRRMTDKDSPPLIDRAVLRSLRDTAALPRPEALLDEAVLWIARHSTYAGQSFDVTHAGFWNILGTRNDDSFAFVASWMVDSGFFLANVSTTFESTRLLRCRLSPQGWQRYNELSQTRAASRFGFMAMKFDDSELEAVLQDHFIPEVRKAGFELRRLLDGQGAGLIDDQLRVSIRTSRFLVCDLTHGNRGAYWEAGFAEGLEKPVIYTCRVDVFKDTTHENRPHFDTNHMVTVPWDPLNPAEAAVQLKNTIRATLPSEAILVD